MNDLITSLTAAIIREEGRPLTDTNPGDIRDPVWLPGESPLVLLPATPTIRSRRKYWDGTPVAYRLQGGTEGEAFWVPRSRLEGEAGLAHIVALHIAEGDSLSGLIAGDGHYAGFAPSKDKNNTASYIKNVMDWTQIANASVPLWNYFETPENA